MTNDTYFTSNIINNNNNSSIVWIMCFRVWLKITMPIWNGNGSVFCRNIEIKRTIIGKLHICVQCTCIRKQEHDLNCTCIVHPIIPSLPDAIWQLLRCWLNPKQLMHHRSTFSVHNVVINFHSTHKVQRTLWLFAENYHLLALIIGLKIAI